MIERTQDYRIVNRFISWQPMISSDFFYLLEKQGSEPIGLWALHPHKDGVMIHADMGPKCRGKKAIESAKRCFNWVFGKTEFKKIYASIPQENKPACRIASMAGMSYSGTNGSSRLFHVFTGC